MELPLPLLSLSCPFFSLLPGSSSVSRPSTRQLFREGPTRRHVRLINLFRWQCPSCLGVKQPRRRHHRMAKSAGRGVTCISRKEQGDKSTRRRLDHPRKNLMPLTRTRFKGSPKGQQWASCFHVSRDRQSALTFTGPNQIPRFTSAVADPQNVAGSIKLYPLKPTAAKPAGQWNRLRVMITPRNCQIELNGSSIAEIRQRQ